MVVFGLLINGLYYLDIDANVNLNEQVVSFVDRKRPRDEFNHKYFWYHRFGHIGEDRKNRLKKDGILDLVKFELIPTYESYL